MEHAEFSGKTADEAIEGLLALMQRDKDEVDIELIEETVIEGLELDLEPLVIARGRLKEEAGSTDYESPRVFLQSLVDAMDLQAEVSLYATEPQQIVYRIDTKEDAGVLIGRKGQTLEALQYVLNVIFGSSLKRRIQVDVGDYRERHHQKLLEQVNVAAERVRLTGRRFTMPPMTASDRRVVHMAIIEHADLQTVSTGEEPNRRVIVELKQEAMKAFRAASGFVPPAPRPARPPGRPTNRFGGPPRGPGPGGPQNFDSRGPYQPRRPR